MFPHNRSPLEKEMTKRPRPDSRLFLSSHLPRTLTVFLSYLHFIELSSGSLWVFDFNVFIVIKIDYLAVWFRMGYCIYIRIPPVQDLPFLLTPEDWLKLQSARKTKKNMGLPLKNWVIPLKNVGLPLTNSVKIKASPPKNSIFFTLPLKKSSIFITYPWRIPWLLNQRGADIKCNSPVVLLGVRAWADPRFVSFGGF